MRRRLGLLTATTALALAASVATAGPAGARNVGGTVPVGTDCLEPGRVYLGGQASSKVPCVCYGNASGTFRNLGRGGTDACPEPLTWVKIDRNVGG